MTDSRDKGKRGERELSTVLSKLFNKIFVRSAQVSGRLTSDVVCLDDDGRVVATGFHVECKWSERLNLRSAMDQAKRDAKKGETPIVIHKKNHKSWLVTMEIEDWQEFVEKSNKLFK